MAKYKELTMLAALVFFLLSIIFFIFQKYPEKFRLVSFVPNSLEKQKKEAADKGAKWLISQKQNIPASAKTAYFMQLFNATSDKEMAKKFLSVVNEKGKEILRISTQIDINDKKYLDWNVLRLVVRELLYKKCEGKDYIDDTQVVKKYIQLHLKEIFPEDMELSQKIVFAYLLKELGIDINNFYKNTISEIRSKSNILNDSDLYALNHIIFTESGYYSKYLDKEKYKKEVSLFDKALETFMKERQISQSRADILSETIISQKLLKIGPSKRTEELYKRLISLQNPDGSWGEREDADSVKYHHTIVATLALMEFSKELRNGKIYCTSTP